MVYAVATLRHKEKIHFLAATELCGEGLYFSPSDYQPTIASQAPGGVMSLVPVHNSLAVLAIEQSYPIYRFENSCVTLATAGPDPPPPWPRR